MGGEKRRGGGHPPQQTLERLSLGLATREETAAVAAHLAGCADCADALGALLAPTLAEHDGGPPSPYELPLARAAAFGRELVTARSDAVVQFAEILDGGHPAKRRSAAERLAWCELLVSLVESAPAEEGARTLARLARVGAAGLPVGELPATVVHDMRARAAAEEANVLRCRGDLVEASEVMAEALEELKEGTGDPLTVARVLDLCASLERARRRFPEALAALDAAERLYRMAGDRHRAGRALVKKSMALAYDGRPDAALDAIGRGLQLLDLDRDPQLALAGVHNVLYYMAEVGAWRDGAALLWRARRLYERFGSRLDRIRLLGIEAKIAHGLGDRRRAERLFRAGRSGFEEESLVYVAAVVTLDLGILLLEDGRAAEVVSLVDEIIVTFSAQRVTRELMMSLLLLREALVQGEATVALVRQTAEAVRRAEEEAMQGKPPA